jgi:hypothetical protein
MISAGNSSNSIVADLERNTGEKSVARLVVTSTS